MKNILGLDLGTNSIGWAVVATGQEEDAENSGKILLTGSRILPMDAATLSDFAKGNTQSQTRERTRLRLTRRIIERSRLRRHRLNRVLRVLGWLPEHYAGQLDRYGKFLNDSEPQLAWEPDANGAGPRFLFREAFEEMLADFRSRHGDGQRIPYDWTLYYLRQKALTRKISACELAWVLHSFNQKRGYFQLRSETEVKDEDNSKKEEYYSLTVTKVESTGEMSRGKAAYNVHFENGMVYPNCTAREAPLWEGKVKEFIVTTKVDAEGRPICDKEGNVSRTFRVPKEDDWGLVKVRTEELIRQSEKTVGQYIYDSLMEAPQRKIRGAYLRTVDRKFYLEEIRRILECQKQFHPELQSPRCLQECIAELYPHNLPHARNLSRRDLCALLVDDVLFYQRPLRSQKGLVSECPYEFREYVDRTTGEIRKSPIKCIPCSHPLFQEFRLWQFIGNLRIYRRIDESEGKVSVNHDITAQCLPDHEAYVRLFDDLSQHKSIKQAQVLRHFKLSEKDCRWNYVDEKDKEYPAYATRAQLQSRLKKAGAPKDFLQGLTPGGKTNRETALWHLLYSISNMEELEKALRKFAAQNGLDADAFVSAFRSCPPFNDGYAAYSARAIGRLLPLMRRGSRWSAEAIDAATRQRIERILNGEVGDGLSERTCRLAIGEPPARTALTDFQGLSPWLACYVVYDRHSEAGQVEKWETPDDINRFLRQFRHHSLRNPIVEQVVLETLRVVRDVWKDNRVGHIDEIHVEIGRDMKNPADKRRKMTETINRNEQNNLRIKALLAELAHPEYEVENVRPYSPIQQEKLRIYEETVLDEARKKNQLDDDIAQIVKKFNESDEKKRPTPADIRRYKLWLEQRYRSPYTGRFIPLARLFTRDYEIEHIVPQKLYYDDSFQNKVICEAAVNKLKDCTLARNFIEEQGGSTIECGGQTVAILKAEAYELLVKDTYAHNPRKLNNLLRTEVPEEFSSRQLNDSRYISRYIVQLLSNIVRTRDENGNCEDAANSRNLIVCSGAVTDRVKKDWGLNDVWNKLIAPRFERLNHKMGSQCFGQWENKEGKRVFQINLPLEYQKGFSRKRIDHRHHALDAIAIACVSRNVVNYLNNISAIDGVHTTREDLRRRLCEKHRTDNNGNYEYLLRKPWPTFTQETADALDRIVVSFKQNLRVLTRTANQYQCYDAETGKKVWKRQEKGDRFAIRKSLHKDTVFGRVNLCRKKTVRLSEALKSPQRIVDKAIRRKVFELLRLNYTPKLMEKYFRENQSALFPLFDPKKVSVYYFTDEVPAERMVATRKPLGPDTKIENITDSGIRDILTRHLERYGGKREEAFSPEGLEYLNSHLPELNNGRPHQPIRRVRTMEIQGAKFAVGTRGRKKDKYVEADKGTNLFFAVYLDENGKRTYDTLPLNLVIERQKQKLPPVPERNDNGDRLLFTLSPNDLVYVPTPDEIGTPLDVQQLQRDRIYKMVSATGKRCFFIPINIANPIIDTLELGSNNKAERSWTDEKIQEICLPLRIDRTGQLHFR